MADNRFNSQVVIYRAGLEKTGFKRFFRFYAGVECCGNEVERRSGKYFGAGAALRQISLATGGTLTLKRSGKSRRTS